MTGMNEFDVAPTLKGGLINSMVESYHIFASSRPYSD